MSEPIPRGLYSIEDFNTEGRRGAADIYGFSIMLSAPVVAALLKTRRNENAPLLAALHERIHRSFAPERAAHIPAPEFVGDSWLLASLRVPGDCACFFINRDVTESLLRGSKPCDLRYSSHNLRSIQEAACVLSVWLMWFNHVASLLDIELPYAS